MNRIWRIAAAALLLAALWPANAFAGVVSVMTSNVAGIYMQGSDAVGASPVSVVMPTQAQNAIQVPGYFAHTEASREATTSNPALLTTLGATATPSAINIAEIVGARQWAYVAEVSRTTYLVSADPGPKINCGRQQGSDGRLRYTTQGDIFEVDPNYTSDGGFARWDDGMWWYPAGHSNWWGGDQYTFHDSSWEMFDWRISLYAWGTNTVGDARRALHSWQWLLIAYADNGNYTVGYSQGSATATRQPWPYGDISIPYMSTQWWSEDGDYNQTVNNGQYWNWSAANETDVFVIGGSTTTTDGIAAIADTAGSHLATIGITLPDPLHLPPGAGNTIPDDPEEGNWVTDKFHEISDAMSATVAPYLSPLTWPFTAFAAFGGDD